MLLSVLFGVSSCKNSFYVTSPSAFERVIGRAMGKIESEGYMSIGSHSKKFNDPEVIGVSYTRSAGFGTAMVNNHKTVTTYSFKNATGDSMSFTISYSPKMVQNIPYIDDVELCGCETSNPNDYEKMCGKDSPVSWVKFMPQNQEIRYVSPGKTIGIIGGIALLIGLSYLIISSR